MSFVSSESDAAVSSLSTKSWKSVKAALWSVLNDGWRKLNIDDTNLPDAWSIHCVEMVNIMSTAKCRVSAGSVQLDNCSNNACLWHKIKFLSNQKEKRIEHKLIHHVELTKSVWIFALIRLFTCLFSCRFSSKSFRMCPEHFRLLPEIHQSMHRPRLCSMQPTLIYILDLNEPINY